MQHCVWRRLTAVYKRIGFVLSPLQILPLNRPAARRAGSSRFLHSGRKCKLHGTKLSLLVYALAFLTTGVTAEGKTNSSLATFSVGDEQHVVYVDVNQHINQAAYNGSGWYNQDLTSLANTGTVAAFGTSLTVYLASDGPRIYYVDTNQHLNELGDHGSAWVNFDVTALANAGTIAAPDTALTTYLASDGPAFTT